MKKRRLPRKRQSDQKARNKGTVLKPEKRAQISLDEDIKIEIAIPKELVKKAKSKRRVLNELILYLRPVFENDNMVKLVIVGSTLCTEMRCELMVQSCSSCHKDATKDAKEIVEKDDVKSRANKIGIIIPKVSLLADGTLPKIKKT